MRFFRRWNLARGSSERLIKLEDFEMWVDPAGRGLHRGLLKRAEKLAKGDDPGPEREPEFHWIIRKELSELCQIFADRDERLVIYNLGANIGLSTLKMNHIAKSLLSRNNYFIYAIEPDPVNIYFLKKNITHNNARAQAFDCAISDFNGSSVFYRSSHSNLGALIKNELTDAGTYQVQVYSLPGFAKLFETGNPHFLKIDVEGGEVEVLRGAREFFAGCKAPCRMIMEVHPGSYSKERSLETELRFLFENGWMCKYLVSAGVVQPDKFKQAGLQPFKEFHTKNHSRGIYRDFSKEHVLEFACYEHIQEIPGKKPSRKIVRSIFLEKER
jgi:FkbM family methyltransferase